MITSLVRSGLKKISPRFPAIMEDMVKSSFENSDSPTNFSHPMCYETAIFLASHPNLIKKAKIGLSEEEAKEIDQTTEKLNTLQQLKDFLKVCRDVHSSVLTVYIKLSSDKAESKLFMGSEQTKEEDIKILEYALERYQWLIKETKEFPEWQEKVKQEIGQKIVKTAEIGQK